MEMPETLRQLNLIMNRNSYKNQIIESKSTKSYVLIGKNEYKMSIKYIVLIIIISQYV